MKDTQSLNQNYMFRRLYKYGKNSVDSYIAVYIKKNSYKKNRLGITATKKIGNAVERNRARRLIKEAYRLCEDEIPKGLDIVIVARKRAVFAKMQNIRRSLLNMIATKKSDSKGTTDEDSPA